MSAAAPNVQMRMDTAQQFVNYQKKTKKKTAVPIIIIAAIVTFLIFIGSVVAILALVGVYSYDPEMTEETIEYHDVPSYEVEYYDEEEYPEINEE